MTAPPTASRPSLARLRELERDLSETIPPEGGPDSARLFREMTARSLALLEPAAGALVLDLACGMGQDALALAATAPAGARTLGVEPSGRMIRWGQAQGRARAAAGTSRPGLAWVRGFAEELPFRDGSADAVLCKGAMDHFHSPAGTMAEIARILKPGGRCVLAIANFDSLSCRLGRLLDRLRGRGGSSAAGARRPFHEPPADHVTRFGHHGIVALARPPLRLARVEGISLLWGFPPWGALLARLGPRGRVAALAPAFALGRLFPALADVIVVQAIKDAPSHGPDKSGNGRPGPGRAPGAPVQ